MAVIVGFVLCGLFAYEWYMDSVKNDEAFFESDIVAFEQADKLAFPPSDGIVFVGSSSIRFWDSLASDMAPISVVRRGFGGAHMSHVLYNFDRIITPYQPKAVVVFVGGNDMGAGKSAQTLISDYKVFINKFNQALPDADLWILAMKPSKLRWDLWGEMQKVDVAFRALAASSQKIHFAETGKSLLGSDGEPDDVYVLDGLHLNDEGYRRWSAILKPLLLAEYGILH